MTENIGLRPRIMWHLCREGPLTNKSLSERMGEKYESTKNATAALWRAGLLMRRRDPNYEGTRATPFEYAIRIPEDSNE